MQNAAASEIKLTQKYESSIKNSLADFIVVMILRPICKSQQVWIKI